MESEELRLLRENNTMLKQIIKLLVDQNINGDAKGFMIDFIANILANNYEKRSY